MKRLIPLLLFTAKVFCFGPAQPVVAKATQTSPSFSIRSGDLTYELKHPEGWGSTDQFADKTGFAKFILCPISLGPGCTVEVSSYPDESEAESAAQNLMKIYNGVSTTESGFEVQFERGWYSCYIQGRRMVEMTYRIPRTEAWGPENKDQYAQNWETLKGVFKLLEACKFEDLDFGASSAVYWEHEGWVMKHPDKPIYVLYKSRGIRALSSVRRSDHSGFLLNIQEGVLPTVFAFLSLEWDPAHLDTEAPYRDHLESMAASLKKIHPNQAFYNVHFELKEGHAFWFGNPYTFVTFQGTDFLCGFALKVEDSIRSRLSSFVNQSPIDAGELNRAMNSLIKNVSWLEPSLNQ